MQFLSDFETSWVDARKSKKFVVMKTGEWRYQQPVVKLAKCRQCGWCYLFCPTGCVTIAENGYFTINLDYCKGCGVCARECPARAISMVREEVV